MHTARQFPARLIAGALISIFALWSATAQAEEEAAAEDESMAMSYDEKLNACAACHGENGAKPLVPSYPVIAGQYADYIEQSLHDYKSGKRNHPIMSMQVQVLGLTDADMRALGQHFAAKSGLKNLD